jgi:hypothetical protein
VLVSYKQDLRWLAVLFIIGGIVLLSLSLFGVVEEDVRYYPALSSFFFFLASAAFLNVQKVEIEPESSLVIESTSDWRFWSVKLRTVPFDACQAVIIGGPTKRNQGPRFRRVWIECDDEEPLLLTTITRASLPEARQAAAKASEALGVEVQETRRKFPGD